MAAQLGLFDAQIPLVVPPRLVVDGRIGGNLLRGYAYLRHTRSVRLTPYKKGRVIGHVAADEDGRQILVSATPTAASFTGEGVLLVPGGDRPDQVAERGRPTRARWLLPRPANPATEDIDQAEARCRTVTESWRDRFFFRQEHRHPDGSIDKGLRRPQIGALFATLAHWSVSHAPATIVMPTGTGKTETMLAILVCAQLSRVMVVVPNTALREQIAAKFETLGKLQECGALLPGAQLPVVARLTRRLQTPAEVDDLFRRANVVVATMQVAGQSSIPVQERMAELCSHLFIDEAHHIAAKTWADFKGRFDGKPILQFTATPFRTDGKRVDGKFIYTYPLKRAQEEGYFRPVSFVPVTEYDLDDADRAIARRASEQLRADLDRGLDHILMARVNTTERADEVAHLYRSELPELHPVVIHSKIPAPERRILMQELRQRRSRVVVCVDMFGEGFDFPELKVAALHDRHKSLAITLQFIGRFTRDLATIGDASVVANIADEGISNALRNLYAEDADWNHLLRMLGEAATGRARKRAEVIAGFTETMADIPLQTLFPKMSAVVYRTTCATWEPLAINDLFDGAQLYAPPIVNPEYNLAIFVTRDEEAIRWGAVKHLQNLDWNLYVLHWNEPLGLLFINSSSKDFHERIAKAVGDTEDRVSGERVFNVLGGVKRLILTNLGLSHALGKNIRYTMFMGADIADGLSEASKVHRRKSNLFGLGYEGDERVTIGCSAKGRFWSHRIAYDLSEWVEWCDHIGRKLLDEQISFEDVLANVIKAKRLSERPRLIPVMVGWPEDFQAQPEELVSLRVGDTERPFYECEIDVADYSEEGPLGFNVTVGEQIASFEVVLSEDGADFRQASGAAAVVKVRGRERALVESFNDDPPIIHFATGDFLVFNELFELPRGDARQSYDPARIVAWEWPGIDLRMEAQGAVRDPRSIQHRVVQRILAGEFGEFELVFDDDGKGEVADIVALRRDGRKLLVSLFHLKFSQRPVAGRRIDDLYAVCGQAQKSVHWREDVRRLLKHLVHREDLRHRSGGHSRIQKGSRALLQQLLNAHRDMSFEFSVVVVQPGLSKAQVQPAQLDLLGATELFLKETYSIPLQVIGSA